MSNAKPTDIVGAEGISMGFFTLDPSYRIPRYPTLARVEGMGVVERPVAASQARRTGDRALDVGAGSVDRLFYNQTLGQTRSDRRGQRAAGPVSMAGREPRAFPYASACFGHQHVRYGLAGEVPALDQHRPTAKGKQDFAGSAHLGGVADRRTAQDFGFRQIRGEYLGAGDQQLLQPVERGGLDQPGAALCDHD